MKTMRGPVPSRRALMVMVWVVAGLVVAVIAYLFVAVLKQGKTVDEQKMSVGRLEQTTAQQRLAVRRLRGENSRQDRQLSLANQRLIAAGERPVTVPPPAAPQVVFGPAGPRGARGAGGLAGRAGLTGKTGATGERGALGPTGASGTDGATGPTGPAGTDGKDGAAGKDGTDGRSVVSIDCTSGPSSVSMTFHFSYGPDLVVSCATIVGLP